MNKNTLYWNIYEEIKDRIILKKYKVNDIIPSERELSKEFNVSLVTVRQAIEMLQTESYVEKKRGIGTVVINNSLDLRLVTKKNFENILESNNVLTKEVKSISKIKNFICNGEQWEKCTLLVRTYYINDIPYMYSENYVRCNIDRLEDDSLYLTLYKKNYKLNKFTDKLGVELKRKDVLSFLNTESALKRVRYGYVENKFEEKVTEYSLMYYNTDVHEYEFEFHNL